MIIENEIIKQEKHIQALREQVDQAQRELNVLYEKLGRQLNSRTYE